MDADKVFETARDTYVFTNNRIHPRFQNAADRARRTEARELRKHESNRLVRGNAAPREERVLRRDALRNAHAVLHGAPAPEPRPDVITPEQHRELALRVAASNLQEG